jgi:hypothetical protein
MAAGLGFKEFTTGDVLTAADANGYLASQVVMVFADAAARTAAITSPQEGMISYLKDTDATQSYSGSAWVTIGASGSPLTTKGDLYTYSTTDARLGVGANDTVLTADSSTATGLKWAAPASGGGMTLISTTTLTGTTVTLNSFSGYTDLQLVIIGAYGNNQIAFRGRFNGDSGSNYYNGGTFGGTAVLQDRVLLGDGLSSSSTNVNLRNFTVLDIQRYAATHGKTYRVQSGYIFWNNTATNYAVSEYGIYSSATAITSIDLQLTSGNFSGGTAYLYGVK